MAHSCSQEHQHEYWLCQIMPRHTLFSIDPNREKPDNLITDNTTQLPSIRGLPHYQTVISKDTHGTKPTIQLESAKPSYPDVPQCGNWECLNGPPIRTHPLTLQPYRFESYSICDKCAKIAPDPYTLGLVRPLPDWNKRKRNATDIANEKRARKSKAISYLAVSCMRKLRQTQL